MKKLIAILCFLPIPLFALYGTTFKENIMYVIEFLVNPLYKILFALSFIVFFWGLAKFILRSGNETERVKGKKYMTGGIVVLFVLLTYMTIISLLSGEFNFGVLKKPTLPTSYQNSQ